MSDNQYFSRFPLTLYTNDNKKTVHVIRDVTRRVIISNDSLTNLTNFEDVDVDDGSPPWVVADIYYNDPELYWVILMTNEILDSRFEWPMNYRELVRYVDSKYHDRDGHHHYENEDGEEVNGRMIIYSDHLPLSVISVGDVIQNNDELGDAVVINKISPDGLRIIISRGGFKHGDSFRVVGKEIDAIIRETDIQAGVIPITNWIHELRLNENRRSIRILKPQFIEQFLKEFTLALQ